MFIVGCGGSPNNLFNPFEGSYSGAWTSQELSQSGATQVTIARDGVVTGTVTETSSGSVAVLEGNITSSGVISCTVQYPGQAASTLFGTLQADVDGNLSGDLIQNINGTDYVVSYTYQKQ